MSSPWLAVHSLLRWVVLLDVGLCVAMSAMALKSLPEWRPGHKMLTMAAMIAADLQLLIGALVWQQSAVVQAGRADMAAAMKDPVMRFYTVEHAAMMILAAAALHVGYAKAKRASDGAAAHKAVVMGYGLALVIMIAAVPWPFRAAIGRALLPM